jgi:hypothetical protein
MSLQLRRQHRQCILLMSVRHNELLWSMKTMSTRAAEIGMRDSVLQYFCWRGRVQARVA